MAALWSFGSCTLGRASHSPKSQCEFWQINVRTDIGRLCALKAGRHLLSVTCLERACCRGVSRKVKLPGIERCTVGDNPTIGSIRAGSACTERKRDLFAGCSCSSCIGGSSTPPVASLIAVDRLPRVTVGCGRTDLI